jgi:hypothetical protein
MENERPNDGEKRAEETMKFDQSFAEEGADAG